MAEKKTAGKERTGEEKRSSRIELVIMAVMVLLVGVLLVMGKRTVSVRLPASPDDLSRWTEAGNDGSVVLKSDEGFVSETEYRFKYRSASRNSECVIVFVCLDPETGDEMAERIAYRFTTDALGFVSAAPADVPEDFTLPETDVPTGTTPDDFL